MTKKNKLVLGFASLTAVIAIVPAAVISCGASDTTDSTTKVDNNVTALKNISITANKNLDKTAADVATLLLNNSSNLDAISKYLDTNLIVSKATNDGVTATYSASAIAPSTKVVSTISLDATSTTSDSSTTLYITVNLSLGTTTATQVVDVTGFPTSTDISNQNTLSALSTNLSGLTFRALSTQTVITPSVVYAGLNSSTPINITNLGKYFDTTAITTAINAASTSANPITVNYTINKSSTDDTNGIVGITITLSMGSGTTLISQSTNITISGFLTIAQAAINTYIQTSFKNNTAIKGIDTVVPSTISPTTGISMTNIANYISGIDTTLPTNTIATFSITTNTNSDLTGTLSLSITLTAPYAAATTASITVKGFKASVTSDQAANLVTLQGIATQIGALSLATTTKTNETSATIYAAIKSFTTLADLTTYFPTNGITDLLTTGVTSTVSVTTPTTANNTNGTLDFQIVLSLGSGADAVTYTTNFNVSGFLTTAQETVNSYISTVQDLTGDAAIKAINNTTSIPANGVITNANFSTYLTNVPAVSTDSGIVLSFTLTNPSTANGTVDITITAAIGSTTKTSTVITVSGFSAGNDLIVSNYINLINNLADGTIKGISTQVVPTNGTITNANYTTYLSGVIAPTSASGISLSFTLTNIAGATGTVDITITATAGVASQISKSFTVSGFMTTDQNNQNIVDAYITKIDALAANAITAKNKILPSTLTPENIGENLNGLPDSTGLTLTYTITSVSDTTGSLNITITAAIGSIAKISTVITVSGFLTTDQNKINTFVDDINKLSAGTITAKNKILPSTLTPENIGENLNGLPDSTGLILAYNIVSSSADDTAGTVQITITVSITGSSATATSNTITVSGFLTTDQNNQNIVDAYINKIDALAPNTITGNNTVLPDSLTAENIGASLNGLPDSTGLKLTYAIASASNTTGSLDITITAAIGSTTKSSNSIKVSGFKTTQDVLNNFITTFEKNYKTSTDQNTTTPTTAYDALKIKTLTISDFSAYFEVTPINTAIATLNGLSISSIKLVPIGTPNLTNGTLEFTLNLSYEGATNSVTITLTGFQTQAETTEQTANLVKLNTIQTTLAGLHIIASDAKKGETASQIYAEISAISDLNISKLTSYFSTDAINAALATTSGVSNTIAINNPNSNDIKNGTITFTLSLALGSGADEANLNNVTFTVEGFTKVLPTAKTDSTISKTNSTSTSDKTTEQKA